jgi:hypothetical protein
MVTMPERAWGNALEPYRRRFGFFWSFLFFFFFFFFFLVFQFKYFFQLMLIAINLPLLDKRVTSVTVQMKRYIRFTRLSDVQPPADAVA